MSYKIGIIGGSGLDNPDLLVGKVEKSVTTAYGDPSDSLILGTINGVQCVLLSRHGRNHSVQPTDVNYRANIAALKHEGCTHVVVTTACGSLRENIHPGEIVLIDQFIDRTTKRKQTFYGGASTDPIGVCHIPMVDCFSEKLRQVLGSCIKKLGYSFHDSGTMMTIEGPRFSTRAESQLWRQWGADVVNMSTVPEVVLAKEAGLVYASMALVTDYDSWRVGQEAVSVEMVMKTFKENAEKAINILVNVIPEIAKENWDDEIKNNQEVATKSVMSSDHNSKTSI